MSQPFWTRIGFAFLVALALLVSAVVALKGAVRYARLDVPPLQRLQPDNTVAIMLLLLSMLLVVGAIVLPLVVRRKAQARLERRPR
jgi:ABC-type cobalamin transport system permease subunit